MIVLSGALVLVALVLLVLGLTMQDLNFVYGSIAVSLVSFVFLVIGILQRRGETAPSADAPAVSEDAPAPAPSAAPSKADREAAARADTQPVRVPTVGASEEADEQPQDEAEPALPGGTVLVVAGRPRYHVEGCRYLTGKSTDEVDVESARTDGFTPCGVCRPDAVLEAVTTGDDSVLDDAVVDTGVPGAEEPEEEPAPAPRRRASAARTGAAARTASAGSARAGSSRSGSARATRSAGSRAPQAVPEAVPAAAVAPTAPADGEAPVAARKAPARTAPARKAPARKATARTSAPAKTQGDPVLDDPVLDAAPAKAARATGKVVVIPDRGRFHTPSCRFVRGVLGTEELTRTQAAKQGYQACGVCKPA